jgi:hypothetical protein
MAGSGQKKLVILKYIGIRRAGASQKITGRWDIVSPLITLNLTVTML